MVSDVSGSLTMIKGLQRLEERSRIGRIDELTDIDGRIIAVHLLCPAAMERGNDITGPVEVSTAYHKTRQAYRLI